MKIKYVIVLYCSFFSSIMAQSLNELSFGDEHSLDIATWNIEWFPKNDETTVNYVIEIINSLDFDVLGIQELNDTTMFNEMIDSLNSYSSFYESSWFAGLAYIYRNDVIQVNDFYEIYTTAPYWNAFPRSPMIMDLNFAGERYFIINNHLKCCGDGVLDYDDDSDEENRRYTAMNLIKAYVDENLTGEKVVVLGDLNDDISEPHPNNVFQEILNDSNNYQFIDLPIAQGNSSEWSFPNWPSHLDHILVTNEIFDNVNDFYVSTIKIDEYLEGGWNEYDQNISDHRPVAIKINPLQYFDINNDGYINEDDLIDMLILIFENEENHSLGDLNFDSEINIFDIITICDYLFSQNLF